MLKEKEHCPIDLISDDDNTEEDSDLGKDLLDAKGCVIIEMARSLRI